MGRAIEHHSLYRSRLVDVIDVSCRIHRSGVGHEEAARSCSIVFPRRGCYTRHIGSREEFADPGSVLFFRPDEGYRFSHPLAGGDDSTALEFPADVLAEAFGGRRRRHGAFPDFQCRIGLAASRRLQLMRRRIKTGGTPLEVEESSIGLLHEIAGNAGLECGARVRRTRASTRHRQRRLVDRTRELLHERFDQPLSLAGIGRAVGSSPFHLTRLFKTYTGQPMYRYLDHLRLRLALERLVEGETDLARLAGDLGYSSHSHFSDTFRRRFGQSPSQFRGLPSRSQN